MFLFVEFSVLPGRIWVLQTGCIYEIFIEIYDKESQRVFVADVSIKEELDGWC